MGRNIPIYGVKYPLLWGNIPIYGENADFSLSNQKKWGFFRFKYPHLWGEISPFLN